MRRIWIILLLLVASICKAQNIVPNPNFDDTVHCPDNLDEVNRAEGWFAASGTPDYFNSCFIYNGGTWNVGVPLNSFGYQQALNGNAYVGMATFYNGIREAVGIKLITQLITGTKYYASFYVSLSNALENSCAANKIGLCFSSNLYQWSDSTPVPIMNQSEIYTDSIITDTLNWVKIKGSFVADSNYTYIYVGNFFADSLVSYKQLQGPDCVAYYYVDDICVSDDSSYCDTWLGTRNIVKPPNEVTLFPNPFTDSFSIKDVTEKILRVELYDAIGETYEVMPETKDGEILINVRALPYGIFLLKITFQNKIENYKIIHN